MPERSKLRVLRPATLVSVLAAFFSCLLFALATAGCAVIGASHLPEDHGPLGAASQEASRETSQERSRDVVSRGSSGGKTLSASIPAEDARGEPVDGLPRYPGSVRAGYSVDRSDGLVTVHAAYLTERTPDAVRDFYTGVFGSEGWEVANMDYYAGGEWYFLVTSGAREASVEISPRGGGSRVEVEVRRPRAGVPGQEGSPSSGGSNR